MVQKTLLTLIIASITILSVNCKEVPEPLKKWQEKELKKRYGSAYKSDPEKLEDWEEEVKKYEEIIDENIRSTEQSGNLYRKMGETYGAMEMYDKCEEMMNKSIALGPVTAEHFYTLGLCQGSAAKIHNWDFERTKKAEESFLKCLGLDSSVHRAKYQLGILYYYGFGSNNHYRVLSGFITVEQKEFRAKGKKLIQEYQNLENDAIDSFFALGNIFASEGETNRAMEQYQKLLYIIQKQYPENYATIPEYQQALINIEQLRGVSGGDETK